MRGVGFAHRVLGVLGLAPGRFGGREKTRIFQRQPGVIGQRLRQCLIAGLKGRGLGAKTPERERPNRPALHTERHDQHTVQTNPLLPTPPFVVRRRVVAQHGDQQRLAGAQQVGQRRLCGEWQLAHREAAAQLRQHYRIGRVHGAGGHRLAIFGQQEHGARIAQRLGETLRHTLEQSLVVGRGFGEPPRHVGNDPQAVFQFDELPGSSVRAFSPHDPV